MSDPLSAMPSDAVFQGRDILLLEDEALLRKRLQRYLEDAGAEVYAARTMEEARRCVSEVAVDGALLDIHLPDGEGLDLLRENLLPETACVIIMTAEGGVRTAVDAIQAGAADYLTKPFDPRELPLIFKRSFEAENTRRLDEFKTAAADDPGFLFTPGLQEIRRQLDQLLETEKNLKGVPPPILIEGATGSGKSTLARWIHRHGARSGNPLVELNCSALPETLVESELFGHERGAFTDAKQARLGLFEAAHKGTLFLDEVTSLPLALQAKLLTAIEDQRIRRLGGNKDINVDIRIITACNRPLADMVATGEFREDLYHRLDLMRLRIPSLKERNEDILPIAAALLKNLAKRYGRPKPRISDTGEERLRGYPWPGNVRELLHELERQLVWTDATVLDFENLRPVHAVVRSAEKEPPQKNNPDDWLQTGWLFPDSGFQLEEAILRLIRLAMDQSGQNVSAAARLLGVKRDYIRYRLRGKEK